MESHRQLAPWVNATGTLDGKPAGIAIMALKTPFGALSSWFLVANPKIPFWYLNPAILQPKPIKLKADTSFTHRYRVIPDDGTWSPE